MVKEGVIAEGVIAAKGFDKIRSEGLLIHHWGYILVCRATVPFQIALLVHDECVYTANV